MVPQDKDGVNGQLYGRIGERDWVGLRGGSSSDIN